ncbi:phasin family protein [Chelatococcus reniformis]|uniref:Phasin family protein n=1 Tax=Chelatococcus reniformis TaxID=1494448 RepID=A0A916U1Q1_9HYPH|nr:phasin family protein [Chelatococcus reniformis]GGC57416.1 phasin family protein [Chelatococcus reniformis]
MMQQFESAQKLGKDQMDAALRSFGSVSKGAQAIATELADYSKRSFEQGTATLEKLVGARSVEKAMEIQSEYIKTSYEALVAESTKLGALYSDLAKEVFKPYEGVFANAKAATEANISALNAQVAKTAA